MSSPFIEQIRPTLDEIAECYLEAKEDLAKATARLTEAERRLRANLLGVYEELTGDPLIRARVTSEAE